MTNIEDVDGARFRFTDFLAMPHKQLEIQGCIPFIETIECSPREIVAESWRPLLGGSLSGEKEYDGAETLSLKGYESMKSREKT